MDLIVAVDQNWAIGKDGEQLLYLSQDLKRFKALTLGHAVILGRRTLYRALLDRCGTAYVTKILAQYPADRYFPDLDADPRWESVEESELLEENGVRFRYVTYRRRQEA